MTEEHIAFQGEIGAHSDLACRQAYPYMKTVPCASFEDIFDQVENGKVALGLIPIENTSAGRVAEIHNILPHTNLSFVGEYFHDVSHSLMAPKGATLETIKTVYSHPQALMQCREHLREHHFTPKQYYDTAAAAKMVAEENDITKAALASNLAATLYGLDVIKDHMQDQNNNRTLFVALAKKPIDPEPKDGPIITSFIFTTRNIPASLYKTLGSFATNNVNLVKLESYLLCDNEGSAQFFVSFEGSLMENHVKLAVEELGFFTKDVKMLGSYLADPKRFAKE